VAIGMSGARVWRLSDGRYLKSAERKHAAALAQEVARTRWLAEHGLPVPKILAAHEAPGFAAMISAAVQGIAADRADMPGDALAAIVGRALARWHAVPADACPFDESLAVRLPRARAAVARDEIDGSDFAARNIATRPAVLLDRLTASRPTEDEVLVHGDASLSNMLITPDRVVFLDCGHAGRGDRYLDLAIAADELAERFGSGAVQSFVAAYGVHWDHSKAGYYADLYELF
jgi:aminoglycoside 3'-phosphotransferase II